MTLNNRVGSPEFVIGDAYAKIVNLLVTGGISYTIHEHAPSVTVHDADANLWFPVERLVKTIAFRVKGDGYVLAGLCGYQHIAGLDWRPAGRLATIWRSRLGGFDERGNTAVDCCAGLRSRSRQGVGVGRFLGWVSCAGMVAISVRSPHVSTRSPR